MKVFRVMLTHAAATPTLVCTANDACEVTITAEPGGGTPSPDIWIGGADLGAGTGTWNYAANGYPVSPYIIGGGGGTGAITSHITVRLQAGEELYAINVSTSADWEIFALISGGSAT